MTRIKFLEIKCRSAMKNTLDGVNSRLDTAIEKIVKLKIQTQKLSKLKHRKKKGTEKNKTHTYRKQ